MKAAVYYENGDPSVLKYEDVPDPECHPKGIVIRVEAVSIEGGDTLNRWRGALVTHAAHRRLPGRRRDRRGRLRGDQPQGRPEGRHHQRLWLPRRVARRAGAQRLGRAGRLRREAGLGHAGRVRHGRRLPVRVRPPEGRRDGAGAGRRQRRRRGGDPAGQARGRHGARHRLERRAAGEAEAARAWITASTTAPTTSSAR